MKLSSSSTLLIIICLLLMMIMISSSSFFPTIVNALEVNNFCNTPGKTYVFDGSSPTAKDYSDGIAFSGAQDCDINIKNLKMSFAMSQTFDGIPEISFSNMRNCSLTIENVDMRNRIFIEPTAERFRSIILRKVFLSFKGISNLAFSSDKQGKFQGLLVWQSGAMYTASTEYLELTDCTYDAHLVSETNDIEEPLAALVWLMGRTHHILYNLNFTSNKVLTMRKTLNIETPNPVLRRCALLYKTASQGSLYGRRSSITSGDSRWLFHNNYLEHIINIIKAPRNSAEAQTQAALILLGSNAAELVSTNENNGFFDQLHFSENQIVSRVSETGAFQSIKVFNAVNLFYARVSQFALGKEMMLDGNTLTAAVNVRQLGSFNTSLLHVHTLETFTATCGAKFVMTRNSVRVDTEGTGSLLPFDSVSSSRTFVLFSGHFVFIEAESLSDASAGFVMTMPIGVEKEDCILPIFEAGNNNNFHVNFVSQEPNSVSIAQGVVLHRTSFIHLDSVQYSKIEVNDTFFNSTFSSPRRLTIRPRYENDFVFLKNATSGVIVVKPVAMGKPTTAIEHSGIITLQRNKVDLLVAILHQNTYPDLFPFTILSNLLRCFSVPNLNQDGFQLEALSDYIVIGKINMMQNVFNSGRRFTPDFLSNPDRYMYSSRMVMNSSLIRLDEDESTASGHNARLLLEDTHVEQNSAFFYSPRTTICETSSSLLEVSAPTVLANIQNFSNGNSLIYSQNYVAESELGWGHFTSGYSIVAALNFVKPYGSLAALVVGPGFFSPFGARLFVDGLSISSDIFTDSQARFMTQGSSEDGYNSFAVVASIFRTIADGSALLITRPGPFYLSIENTNLVHESFLSSAPTGSPVVVYPGGDENPLYRLKIGISLNSVYIYKTQFFPNVVLSNVSTHYRNPRKIRDTVCDFSMIQVLESPVPRQYSVEHSSFIVDAIDYTQGGSLTCPVSLTRSGNHLLPWKRPYAAGSYIHFSHLAPTVSMPTALSFSISDNKFLINQFTTNVGDMDSMVYIRFSVLDLNTQNSIGDGTNGGGDHLSYKIQGQADSKMIIANNTISYSKLENCVSQASGIDILVGGYERSIYVMNTEKTFEFFKIEIEGNSFSSEMLSAGDSCGRNTWIYTHFFNLDCTVDERSSLRPKCLGRQISLRDNSHTVSMTSFFVGISAPAGFLRPMHLASVNNVTFYNQSEDEIASNFFSFNGNTVVPTPSEINEIMAVSILFEATGNRVHHTTPFIPSTSDESENTLIRLSQQSDCSLRVASNEIKIKYTFEDFNDSNVYLPILKVLSVDHQLINTTNRVNTPMSIHLLNNKVKLPAVYKLSIFDLGDSFPTTLDNLRVDGNSVFALYPQPDSSFPIWQPEMFLLNFQRIESTISFSFPLPSSTTSSTNNGTHSSSSSSSSFSYPIFSISDNFYSNQMIGDQSPDNGFESPQIQQIYEAIVNLPELVFTAELEDNLLIITEESVRGFLFTVSRNNFDLPEIDEAVVFSFPGISSNNIAYLNLEFSSNIFKFQSVYRSPQALSDLSNKLSARYSAVSLTAETRSDLIIYNNTVRATNMNNDFITTLTAFDFHLRFFEAAPSFYVDFSQNTIQGFIEPNKLQQINIYGLKLSKSQSTDSLLRVADFNLTADGNYLAKKSVMNSIVLNAHLRDQNQSIVLDCTLIKFDFQGLSWGSTNSIFSSSLSEIENRQAVSTSSTENNDNLLLRRTASFLNISNNYAFHEDSFTNISFSFLQIPSSPNIHLQQMIFERNLLAQEWTIARGVLIDYIPEKDVQGRNPLPQRLRVFGETRMFKNSWNKINDARSGLTFRSLVYDDTQYFGGFFAGDMTGAQQDEFPLDFEGGLFIDGNTLLDVTFELFTWRKMIDVNVTTTTTLVPTSTNNSSAANDTITNTTEDPSSSSSSGSSPSWRIERIYAPITPSSLSETNFTLLCNHPENYWPSDNFTSMTLMYFPNTHFNFLACPYTPTKTLSKTIPPPTRTRTRTTSRSSNITHSISSSLSESHVFSETDNISSSPSSSISISDELSETEEESHTDELTPSKRTLSVSKSVSENSRSFSEGTVSTTPELSESAHRVSHTLDSTETRNSTPSKSHSETDSFYETPEKTAMQLAREVLEDVAAGASLLTIPAPTVAFGVARQQSMQQLLNAAGDGKCGFDIIKGERLPWSQSPTQLEVPAAGRYRFVVGAVVGNIALTLGLNVLFFLIGILYHAIYGQLNWMPMLGIATQAHLSAIFVVFVAVFYGSTLYHALSLFFDPYTRQEDLVLVGCMGVLYLLYIVVYLRKTLSNPELWANIVFEYETVDLNPAQSVEEKRRRFEKEEARKIAEHEEEERKRRRLESLDLDQLLHLDSSDDDDLPPVPGSPTVFVDVDALEQSSSDDDENNNNQQNQPRLASTTTTTTNQNNNNDDIDDDVLLGEPQASPSPEKPSEKENKNEKPKEKKKKKNKNKSTESISSSSDDDLDAVIKSFVDSQLTLSQRICLRFRQIMSWWFGDLGTWRYTKNATRHQRLLFHFSLPVIEGYTSTAPRFILFELALQTIFAIAVIAGELLAESPERSCKAQGMIMALGMGGFLAVLLWLKPVQPRIAYYTTLVCVFLSLAIVLLTTIIDPQHGMIEYFQIVLMVSETLLAVVMFIWFCHRIYLSILRNKFLLSSSVNHDGSSDRLEKFKEDDSRRAVVSDILTRPIFRGVAEDPPKKHFSPRPKSTDEKLKSILSSGGDKKTNKKKNSKKRRGKRSENNDRDNDDENNNDHQGNYYQPPSVERFHDENDERDDFNDATELLTAKNFNQQDNTSNFSPRHGSMDDEPFNKIRVEASVNNNNNNNSNNPSSPNNNNNTNKKVQFKFTTFDDIDNELRQAHKAAEASTADLRRLTVIENMSEHEAKAAAEARALEQIDKIQRLREEVDKMTEI